MFRFDFKDLVVCCFVGFGLERKTGVGILMELSWIRVPTYRSHLTLAPAPLLSPNPFFSPFFFETLHTCCYFSSAGIFLRYLPTSPPGNPALLLTARHDGVQPEPPCENGAAVATPVNVVAMDSGPLPNHRASPTATRYLETWRRQCRPQQHGT